MPVLNLKLAISQSRLYPRYLEEDGGKYKGCFIFKKSTEPQAVSSKLIVCASPGQTFVHLDRVFLGWVSTGTVIVFLTCLLQVTGRSRSLGVRNQRAFGEAESAHSSALPCDWIGRVVRAVNDRWGWKFKLHVIMHARAHTYMYTKHANVHTHRYTHTRAHAYTYMNTHTCTVTPQAHTYTSARAYTYMNTHTCIHTCTFTSPAALEAYYLRECGLVKLKQIILEKNVMHT